MSNILRLSLPVFTASAIAVVLQSAASAEPTTPTLRKAYADDFLVGVALNMPLIDGRNAKAGEVAARQFSSVTPENEMKWQSVHPQPDVYQFGAADAFAEFAGKNDMKLIGHCLVWHSQTPSWVFQGENGHGGASLAMTSSTRPSVSRGRRIPRPSSITTTTVWKTRASGATASSW
jgi:GH35 family endo-1,4-beta-xylanase